MPRRIGTMLVTWLLATALISPASAGPLEDAAAAYSKQDYATALKLWRPLANKGNAEAQNRLGTMYYLGKGVEQDQAEAVKWFRRAADRGYAGAQINLATAYGEGYGVKRDMSQAAKWYRRAAEQGNALAQNNLGVMYSKGEGVSRDLVRAHMWYSLSAAQGNNAGTKNRDRLTPKMTTKQVEEAQRLAKAWKPKKS
jgi:TPR repeat protein